MQYKIKNVVLLFVGIGVIGWVAYQYRAEKVIPIPHSSQERSNGTTRLSTKVPMEGGETGLHRAETLRGQEDEVTTLARFRLMDLRGLEAALASIDSGDFVPEERLRLLRMLFRAWGERFPETGVKVALERSKVELDAVLSGWGSTDARAAWAWVAGLPQSQPLLASAPVSYFDPILEALVAGDQGEEALNLLETIHSARLRAMAEATYGVLQLTRNRDHAAEWLAGLAGDGSGFRPSVVAGLMGQALVKEGIPQLGSFLGTQNERVQQALIGAAVRHWAITGQYEKITEFADQVPATSADGYDYILHQAGVALLGRAPESADLLFQAIRSGAARDAAYDGAAAELAQTNPAAARMLAEKIRNFDRREGRLETIRKTAEGGKTGSQSPR